MTNRWILRNVVGGWALAILAWHQSGEALAALGNAEALANRQEGPSGCGFWIPGRDSRSPEPVSATVQARIVAEDTGKEIDAKLTEVTFLGTQAVSGRRQVARGGRVDLIMPATARLRAEADGFQPQTLSPFFDHPELIREVTTLDADALLDWRTYERIRARLGEVSLTFRLRRAAVR